MKQIADQEGYEIFTIPNDVGGRYSVLTSVGLLPIAVAGINIDALMLGAKCAQDKFNCSDLEKMTVTNMPRLEIYCIKKAKT